MRLSDAHNFRGSTYDSNMYRKCRICGRLIDIYQDEYWLEWSSLERRTFFCGKEHLIIGIMRRLKRDYLVGKKPSKNELRDMADRAIDEDKKKSFRSYVHHDRYTTPPTLKEG